MIYVITHPAVKPEKRTPKWWLRGTVFTLSAGMAGAIVGSGLGSLGSVIGTGPLAVSIPALASIGILVGAREAAGIPLSLKQFNRETSRRRRPQPLLWALYNGVTLGAGFRTRVGFTIWYAVPAAAIATGSWLAGAIVYGTYGAARGVAPWILLASGRFAGAFPRDFVLRQRATASSISGLALITLCATVIGKTASGLFS